MIKMFVSDNLSVNENGNLTIGGVDTVESADAIWLNSPKNTELRFT